MRYALAVVMISVVAISCEKATDPPTATSLAANSSATITATVGASVTPPPSVLIKDQRGNPMSGVPVTFAVTSGNGSVTGPSAMTGANGVATVGAWVLGSAVGQNVLTASSGTLAAVTFTATTTAGPASALTKVAGDNVSATVGSAISSPPSVSVKDAFGNPIAGVSVTFAIGLGGGTLTNATRTTGADGIATVGSWTLGTAATSNTVTATAGSLSPVTFTATALAGPASRIVALSGNGISGRAGVLSLQPISARVTDSFNNGVSGVQVVFAISQGGGVIFGPSTVATNGDGTSTLPGGWVLGAGTGTNLLTATAAGVGSVTFTATGTPNVCIEQAHTVGTTVNGQLSSSDCQLPDGSSVDFYNVPVPALSAFVFTEKSSAIDPYMYVTDGAAFPFFFYGEDDDDDESTNARLKVIAPAGAALHVGAGSYSPGEAGAYQFASAVVDQSEEDCDLFFVLPGVTTNQTISSGDCIYSATNPLRADLFGITIRAGTTMTFHMSSTSAVDPFLELYDSNLNLLATNDNQNASTKDAEIKYTATVTNYYYIATRPAVAGQTGAYSLSFVLSGSASSLKLGVEQPKVRPAVKKPTKLPVSRQQ